MRSDENFLKDALFNDQDFFDYVHEFGLQDTLDDISELRRTVADQLEADRDYGVWSADNPQWRKSATALVIRAKSRIRVINDAMREGGIK